VDSEAGEQSDVHERSAPEEHERSAPNAILSQTSSVPLASIMDNGASGTQPVLELASDLDLVLSHEIGPTSSSPIPHRPLLHFRNDLSQVNYWKAFP
jgi:hypothetical protein